MLYEPRTDEVLGVDLGGLAHLDGDSPPVVGVAGDPTCFLHPSASRSIPPTGGYSDPWQGGVPSLPGGSTSFASASVAPAASSPTGAGGISRSEWKRSKGKVTMASDNGPSFNSSDESAVRDQVRRRYALKATGCLLWESS